MSGFGLPAPWDTFVGEMVWRGSDLSTMIRPLEPATGGTFSFGEGPWIAGEGGGMTMVWTGTAVARSVGSGTPFAFFAASSASSFFLCSNPSPLFSLCNGVGKALRSEEMGVATYLDLPPAFPSLPPFLPALKLLPFFLPLRWSQNRIPSREVGITMYFELLEFSILLLFLWTLV